MTILRGVIKNDQKWVKNDQKWRFPGGPPGKWQFWKKGAAFFGGFFAIFSEKLAFFGVSGGLPSKEEQALHCLKVILCDWHLWLCNAIDPGFDVFSAGMRGSFFPGSRLFWVQNPGLWGLSWPLHGATFFNTRWVRSKKLRNGGVNHPPDTVFEVTILGQNWPKIPIFSLFTFKNG